MEQDIQKKKSFIISVAYVAVGLAIYYVIFRYVIHYTMPFVLAILFTFMLKRPIENLSKKIGVSRRLAAAVVVLAFFAVLFSIATIVIIRVSGSVLGWAADLPYMYQTSVEPLFSDFLNWYEEQLQTLSPGDTDRIQQINEAILYMLRNGISTASSYTIAVLSGFVLNIPKYAISIVFCAVATVFLSMDYPRIRSFVLGQLTERGRDIVLDSKNYLSKSLIKMVGSYALIMFITMCELYIGFKVIGLQNALALALLIAVFDILPALGTGGIMIPWVLIELIGGDHQLALKLFIIYLVVTFIRNILEPKIVGDSIGLHPVLMLMSIYLGVTIFGALGIVILPFTLIIIKQLNDTGRIYFFKKIPYVEEPARGFFERKRRSWARKQARKRAAKRKEEAAREAVSRRRDTGHPESKRGDAAGKPDEGELFTTATLYNKFLRMEYGLSPEECEEGGSESDSQDGAEGADSRPGVILLDERGEE